MDQKALGRDIVERLSSLKPEHDQFEPIWFDCAEFSMGFYEGNSNRTDQTKLSERCFDETAILAGEFFDCAMHGMLANPAGTIFALETEDPDLMEYDEVRQHLQQSTRVIHHVLENTNFHLSLAREFTNIRTFGTAPLFIGDDFNRGVYFFPSSILSTYCAENNLGVVDTVFREFEYTARNAAKQWGEDKLPRILQEHLKRDNKVDREWKFKFIHAVFPREERKAKSRLSVDMPFASVYINLEEEWAIAEGGFQEMPYATPRWRHPFRSAYGSSPCMNVLASIKMIQEMSQDNMIAAHKQAEPPMQIPAEYSGKKVKLYHGGINYYDSQKGKFEEIYTGRGLPVALEMENQRRQVIESGFYKHVLQLPQDAGMTATEVLERVEEQVRVLGPMVGRIFYELFNVAIDRIFGICSRKSEQEVGHLPMPPEILQGQEIKIQYMSSIARAQKISEVKAALQANELLAGYFQLFPQMADNLDPDKMYRDAVKAMGMNQTWMRSEDDRDALRQLRDQAMKEQQIIQQMTQGGQALKSLKEGLSGNPVTA